MNLRPIAIGALTAFLTLAGVAVSHEMPYVQAQPGKPNPSTGVSLSSTDCGTGNNPALNLSFGGVCFGAHDEQGWVSGGTCPTDPIFGNPGPCPLGSQHLTDAATATIDIADSIFALVSAVYCQDLDHEGGCGAPAVGAPPPDPGEPILLPEPNVPFCDTITIRRGLSGPVSPGFPAGPKDPRDPSFGTWADATSNWDVNEDVFVYLGAPLNGNIVVGNPCGANGWATLGSVSHT